MSHDSVVDRVDCARVTVGLQMKAAPFSPTNDANPQAPATADRAARGLLIFSKVEPRHKIPDHRDLLSTHNVDLAFNSKRRSFYWTKAILL